MLIFAQYTIEPATAVWRQDFAPVVFAYCCDPIGIQNSALEKIQSSKELDSMQAEKSLRQICKPEIEAPKTALVSDMMNSQHSLERQSFGIYKHRHQRRCPIMHMQNLQLRRQSAR